MRKPPTQQKMSDPSWAGDGKPNYVDETADSPADLPRHSQLNIAEPFYVANLRRYKEYR